MCVPSGAKMRDSSARPAVLYFFAANSAACAAAPPSRGARVADPGSKGFLNAEIEAARSFLAPAPVGREVGARALVQQDAKSDAGRRRIGVEQLRAGLGAADRRRVEECDEPEHTARRQRAAILDLPVDEV